MIMLRTIAEAIGLIMGSTVAAVALYWLIWTLFKAILHPEWGPPLILSVLVLAFRGSLAQSEFLRMGLIFGMLAIVPLWIEGKEWRAGQQVVRVDDNIVLRYI